MNLWNTSHMIFLKLFRICYYETMLEHLFPVDTIFCAGERLKPVIF